jgi:hypothetical protein
VDHFLSVYAFSFGHYIVCLIYSFLLLLSHLQTFLMYDLVGFSNSQCIVEFEIDVDVILIYTDYSKTRLSRT